MAVIVHIKFVQTQRKRQHFQKVNVETICWTPHLLLIKSARNSNRP